MQLRAEEQNRMGAGNSTRPCWLYMAQHLEMMNKLKETFPRLACPYSKVIPFLNMLAYVNTGTHPSLSRHSLTPVGTKRSSLLFS